MLFAVWSGGAVLTSLLAVAALLGTRELFGLAAARGVIALESGLLAAVIAPYVVFASLSGGGMHRLLDGWGPYLLPALVIVLLIHALVMRRASNRPLAAVAVTLFAVLYAAVLPTSLLQIRRARWPNESVAGAILGAFPLVVPWVCDTAAMFGGRMIGGAKLAPSISPGKTRAGGVAGVLGGMLMGPLFALVIFPRVGIALDVVPATLLAGVLAIVGQLGDLAESLFKREAGVKDSSALIPGHGGVLDRLDSLYFVIPVAAAGYHLLGLD